MDIGLGVAAHNLFASTMFGPGGAKERKNYEDKHYTQFNSKQCSSFWNTPKQIWKKVVIKPSTGKTRIKDSLLKIIVCPFYLSFFNFSKKSKSYII